jgi:hypothetical protein
MFSKKCRLFRPGAAARFLVGVAILLALAAPALAGFSDGQYCTYTQGGWGSVPQGNNPGMILQSNFSTVYAGGFVEVGLTGTPGYSMTFQSDDAIQNYLPAGGKPKPLTQDYINPTTTGSGVFGGQVLALQLNVDFADKDIIGDTSLPVVFGDLVIIGTGTLFDGMTVRQLLNAANMALGTPPTLPANLNDTVSFLNQGFDNCLPSGWVQQYLTTADGPPPPDM